MHAKTDKFIQLALVVAVFGGWEGGIALGVIDPFFFPSPTAIVQQAWTWLSDTSFYQHVYITLTETALGYIIGTGLGVAGGVWLGLSRRSARILDPFIKGFNAIPRVVLAPIFVLWLGLGLWSKVALAVTLVFFTTFFNAMQGVREVNPVVLANARILGASRSDLLRHVYFPAAELDPVFAAYFGRLCRGRCDHRRIPRRLGGPGLPDRAGRRQLQRCGRVRRHHHPGRLRADHRRAAGRGREQADHLASQRPGTGHQLTRTG